MDTTRLYIEHEVAAAADYDLLRERTDLRFDSEGLAERGSL